MTFSGIVVADPYLALQILSDIVLVWRASRAIKELFGTVEVEMKNPFKRPGVVEASGSSASWVARVTFARVHRIDGNRRTTQPNTTLMASTPRTAPDIAPGRSLPK